MKKLTLLMCALITFYSEGISQWKFSAIAGPQLATFGGKDKESWGGLGSDPEMVFRFHLGLLAERRHSEKMAFLAGLLFSSKGTKYSSASISYTKFLSYLDLPLLLRYYQSEKLSFLFGPQLSFLLAAKVKSDSQTEDVKEYYTKIDVGLNLGAAYNLNERMALMLLYQHGLLKIGIDDTYDENAIFNRVIMLSLIYKLKEMNSK